MADSLEHRSSEPGRWVLASTLANGGQHQGDAAPCDKNGSGCHRDIAGEQIKVGGPLDRRRRAALVPEGSSDRLRSRQGIGRPCRLISLKLHCQAFKEFYEGLGFDTE